MNDKSGRYQTRGADKSASYISKGIFQVKNKQVANLLTEIAEWLKLTETNPFRIRAYENAALTIETLSQPVEELTVQHKLLDIPGIGSGIAEKIAEFLSTGAIAYLDELKSKFPPGLIEITNIPGVGPKKAYHLYQQLKIGSIDELEKSARVGKLRDVPGFGIKTEQNILDGIEFFRQSQGRILLSAAMSIAEQIVNLLQPLPGVNQIQPAGSLRRGKETIGDIDILCAVESGKEKSVIDKFVSLPMVQRVQAAGETKASILTEDNVQVDLRVVHPDIYGAALLYFTGSKEHNIALRELAQEKKFTINEYGIFKVNKKDKPVAGKAEPEIYRMLGLDYIPPELRENQGELTAAAVHQLPNLVNFTDILGDTHVHSQYSDGMNSIPEIVAQAREQNLQWLIICDHSVSLKIARGLDLVTVKRKINEINHVQQQFTNIKILVGTEVDILSDGTLDYPDEVLQKFDYVVAGVHTGFKQTERQITDRIVKAMHNPYVHSISHPSGRLINKRAAYAVDLPQILESARQTGTWLEINAYPDRLDLNDIFSRRAKELGVKLTIGTDAHNITQLEFIRYGVTVARRGWLEKKDVINTLSYPELRKVLVQKGDR